MTESERVNIFLETCAGFFYLLNEPHIKVITTETAQSPETTEAFVTEEQFMTGLSTVNEYKAACRNGIYPEIGRMSLSCIPAFPPFKKDIG